MLLFSYFFKLLNTAFFLYFMYNMYINVHYIFLVLTDKHRHIGNLTHSQSFPKEILFPMFHISEVSFDGVLLLFLIFWMHNVGWAASYEMTLVCLSIIWSVCH